MKIAGVLHFNKSTIFFISQRLCVVSNKTKEPSVKSKAPARTRTWNLLIRSQTPYPLGHEADILYKEFYCYFTINCITNIHCNIVILCLHLNEERDSRDFYSFLFPFFCTLQILSL